MWYGQGIEAAVRHIDFSPHSDTQGYTWTGRVQGHVDMEQNIERSVLIIAITILNILHLQ